MRKPDADLIKLLFGDLPDLLLRKDAMIWSKGIFSEGFMRGQEMAGAIEAYDLGTKAVYKKSDLIKWAKALYGIEGTDS